MAKMVNDDGDITEELVALKPILFNSFLTMERQSLRRLRRLR